jgi:hypothetical protein
MIHGMIELYGNERWEEIGVIFLANLICKLKNVGADDEAAKCCHRSCLNFP